MQHGQWIKWLEDERVGFKSTQAEKYMKIARELGDQIPTSSVNLNLLSVNKLFVLASAPDEINIRRQMEIISIWQLKKT